MFSKFKFWRCFLAKLANCALISHFPNLCAFLIYSKFQVNPMTRTHALLYHSLNHSRPLGHPDMSILFLVVKYVQSWLKFKDSITYIHIFIQNLYSFIHKLYNFVICELKAFNSYQTRYICELEVGENWIKLKESITYMHIFIQNLYTFIEELYRKIPLIRPPRCDWKSQNNRRGRLHGIKRGAFTVLFENVKLFKKQGGRLIGGGGLTGFYGILAHNWT